MGKKVNTKYRNRVYVVDFDDFCDATIAELDVLQGLKQKYPTFICTLFTIPSRTSPSTVDAVKKLGDWIKLAPHGYFHTKGECLGWTAEEAVRKIEFGRDAGINEKCFRAPAWLLDNNTYSACDRMGYVVASHNEFRIPASRRDTYPREYIYNTPIGRTKGTRGVHGHLTPVSGNYIKNMLEDGRLAFGEKHKFLTCVEASVVMEA